MADLKAPRGSLSVVDLGPRGSYFKEARLMSFPAEPKDSQTSTAIPQWFIVNYFLPSASSKLMGFFQYALAANVWGK